MDKVDINLLPTEVSVAQRKQAKFGRVQIISIGILFILILTASISVAFRIVQSQKQERLGEEVGILEEKVSRFKDKEATLVVLKNRITAIIQLLGGDRLQTAMFNLITDRIPANVTITTISVDRAGNVLVSLLAPDSNSLEQTLVELTSGEAFEKISKINIESLSSGKDGVYRMNMKIVSKISVKS